MWKDKMRTWLSEVVDWIWQPFGLFELWLEMFMMLIFAVVFILILAFVVAKIIGWMVMI